MLFLYKPLAPDSCSKLNGPGPLLNPNNNPVIENANRTFIVYGNWTHPSLQEILHRHIDIFMPAWLKSPVLSTLKEYGINPGTMNPSPLYGGEIPSEIADSELANRIDEGVKSGAFPEENQFAIFLPMGTTVKLPIGNRSSCVPDEYGNYAGGYHYFTPKLQIPYRVHPFACEITDMNPDDLSPKNITYADNFNAKGGGHEDEEVLSDPWLQSFETAQGNEVADLCASDCDVSTILTSQGNFQVQGSYSNANGRCMPPPNTCMSGNMTVECPSDLPPPTKLPSHTLGTGAKAGIGVASVVGFPALSLGGAAAYARRYPDSRSGKLIRNKFLLLSKFLSHVLDL